MHIHKYINFCLLAARMDWRDRQRREFPSVWMREREIFRYFPIYIFQLRSELLPRPTHKQQYKQKVVGEEWSRELGLLLFDSSWTMKTSTGSLECLFRKKKETSTSGFHNFRHVLYCVCWMVNAKMFDIFPFLFGSFMVYLLLPPPTHAAKFQFLYRLLFRLSGCRGPLRNSIWFRISNKNIQEKWSNCSIQLEKQIKFIRKISPLFLGFFLHTLKFRIQIFAYFSFPSQIKISLKSLPTSLSNLPGSFSIKKETKNTSNFSFWTANAPALATHSFEFARNWPILCDGR